MPPDIKKIVLTNMNVNLYGCTINHSQGSASTDLKGVSFNTSFHC